MILREIGNRPCRYNHFATLRVVSHQILGSTLPTTFTFCSLLPTRRHPHTHSAACSVIGRLHQLYGIIRSRLDRTFERFRMPDVKLRNGQRSHHANPCLYENIPNDTAVELNFGHLRTPLLVQCRLNVEHREHASDDKVHRPNGEVLARTDPGDSRTTLFTIEGGVNGISYLRPVPKTLSSGLNTSGLIFPSLRNLSGLKASGSG